ncbi:DNA (cytosine-5-)-methyltransferase [Mesoplasma entomophilum]|nr:DNA (cytosine-5-)-methyltransferase [Mesoplasma entomophilum]
MSDKIKVVELFAGVGGFSLALKKSKGNYEVIFSNQWEPSTKNQFAFNALNKNFKKHILSNEDIQFAKEKLPNDFDLLVGGFPCQDYSVATTNSKGIEGKKGVLWWEISWILEKHKPNFVFLENVDRLLKSPSNKRGRDFAIILKDLDEKGYNVEWMNINAGDYGYVQRRRRVFILAWRKEKLNIQKELNISDSFDKGIFRKGFKVEKFILEKEIDLNIFSDKVDVTENYNYGKFLNFGVMIDGKIISGDFVPLFKGKQKILKDILEDKVDDSYFLTDEQIQKISILKDRKRMPRTKPNGEKYFYSEGKMSLLENINMPSRTMLTSEGTINRASHFVEDINSKGIKGIRRITPLEAERINGFTDNWTSGVMTERQRYFCMGNALVVPLVAKIGDCLSEKIIEGKK